MFIILFKENKDHHAEEHDHAGKAKGQVITFGNCLDVCFRILGQVGYAGAGEFFQFINIGVVAGYYFLANFRNGIVVY